jgi:tight adherence protein C
VPIVFGAFIAAAVLVGCFTLTRKPSPAQANLFAGLPIAEKPARSSVRNLGTSLRRAAPARMVKTMERDLAQAGHPHGIDVPKLLGIQAVLTIILILIPIALGYPLASLLGALIGFLGPRIWISNERTHRREDISNAISDTTDQLTICVEAGMGFDASLQRVATTSHGPLADELAHTVSDMRAGVPREQALRALADRTQLDEIKSVTQALIQAQRNGTPLADTLRVQAAEQRDQRKQALEEKAAKLGVKMIFPTAVFFFPVLFIVLLAPAMAGLLQALHHG